MAAEVRLPRGKSAAAPRDARQPGECGSKLARIVLLFAFARRHVNLVRKRPAEAEFEPPVSIIVPAFNEAVGIEQAIQSLTASAYPDFEIIVVDDGSTDRTVELLRPYAADGRIRLLEKRHNEGKAMALNDAIPIARGDIVTIVDDLLGAAR